MKYVKFLMFFSIVAALLNCNHQVNSKSQTVNLVLGDISFINKFGVEPSTSTNENLRIKTHLEYVENLLRKREVDHLTKQQKQNRKRVLDLLYKYRIAGVFPKNYDHKGRKPCFIDSDGNICAVGYLLEHTTGRATAEAVNEAYQNEEIFAMNSPKIDEWLDNYGLTKAEAAMIQPTYEEKQSQAPVTLNIMGTSILSIGNIGVNTINIVQLAQGNSKPGLPITGICTGSAQLALGLATYSPNDDKFQKDLSFTNIGIGSATVLLSTWNLFHKTKQLTSWNVFSYPASKEHLGVGVSFSKKF